MVSNTAFNNRLFSLTLLVHLIACALQLVLQFGELVAQLAARIRNCVHLVAQHLNFAGQLVHLDDQIVLDDVERVSVHRWDCWRR